jgi:hypothetical protein
LKWVRTFIEYARYELEPGEQQAGDQFPRQSAADKAMAEIDAVLAAVQALREQVDRRVRQEAELHDIIGKLWSVVDPEVAPELMAVVHGVLGANDPEGHCGNRICAELLAAEQRAEAAEAQVQALQQQGERQGPSVSVGVLTVDVTMGRRTFHAEIESGMNPQRFDALVSAVQHVDSLAQVQAVAQELREMEQAWMAKAETLFRRARTMKPRGKDRAVVNAMGDTYIECADKLEPFLARLSAHPHAQEPR